MSSTNGINAVYIEYKCLYIYIYIYENIKDKNKNYIWYLYMHVNNIFNNLIWKVNNDYEENGAKTCVWILIVKDVIVHKFSWS